MKCSLAPLLALLLFTRCAEEELPAAGQGNLSRDVDIALNETVALSEASESRSSENKVRVHLAEINDSRCPMNVNCIRYGSAVAQLWLEQDQEKSPTVALVIGEALPNDPRKLRNRTADTTLVTVANTRYQVILKNVTPYPCAGCPNQETPRAQIVVTTK
ncbi:hypothetical protein [Adhaeribacter pallidiroseus]|uniref:Uncharacterized protein n=1 Tax=Adhaeribacter pallidiroseus TaxID=2072847 RepID=A0A369QQ28_9BACT|nr:hypothetical protein [Adhaeribacter pallidiroseus]RDC66412.1 hypothetical protein AHMF7616_05043 [Adhaeribacter pallidiroseus]